MSKFSITIIGSNSARPAYGRSPSAQWLNIDNHFYLIDCGEGTLSRLIHAKLRYTKLKAIFISHLHGDHYFGLAPLLFTMNFQRRVEPLYLYAPIGLAEILTLQLKQASTKLGYPLHFIPTNTQKTALLHRDETISVHTSPLSHRVPCAAFRFAQNPKNRKLIKHKIPTDLSVEKRIALKNGENIYYQDKLILNTEWTKAPDKPRIYAYCSDTIYDERIVPFVSEAHTLYHEATFTEAQRLRASQTFHSTARQAASIAKQAAVEKLLIGHFSARYANLNPLLEEAKRVFPNTFLAEEGKTFNA
ncbi:MAG: ribonuclease Z [Bernardetiaceae bacterium]|nr:ribonuclease Z [Bernardetiaceae bacterium]